MSKKQGRAVKAAAKVDDLPDLMPHRAIAAKLGITPEGLRDWVHKGMFPEPHSRIGQIWFYRLDHFRAYLVTGKWPEGVEFRRPSTRMAEDLDPPDPDCEPAEA